MTEFNFIARIRRVSKSSLGLTIPNDIAQQHNIKEKDFLKIIIKIDDAQTLPAK